MAVSVRLNTKEFLQAVTDLRAAVGRREANSSFRKTASLVLNKAKKRAPRFTGDLRGSSFIGTGIGGNLVIGFDADQARVQDTGWTVPVIRPVRAKALFVPLTPAAASRGAQRSGGKRRNVRRSSRRSAGRPGITRPKPNKKGFLILPYVKTRAVQRFGLKGPNLYFTGTLDEMSRSGEILQSMTKEAQALLAKATRGRK